jgi:plastocyanin
MSRYSVFALLLTIVAIGPSSAQADDWGNLKGKFIYDGAPPASAPITVDKDQAVCGDKGLVAEDLVVDANGGLANVMIYVKGKVKIHPDYEKTADATVVLDNHGCRFEPHVQGVRVGQTLEIKNSDPVAHNTNVVGRNLQINPLIPAGATSDQKIEAPEALPAMVSCNIHPWMKARLLVRSSPYFAVSKKDGTFEIKNLPAGDLEFIVYQERSGYVQDAVLKGQQVKWPKGVVKATIEAGKDTDLGDIKLPVDQFNK